MYKKRTDHSNILSVMYFSLKSLDIWIRDLVMARGNKLLNELDKNHIHVISQTIKYSFT